MALGSTTFTAVSWTTGDVITETKLDNMQANTQAYDSHAAEGLLLNNNTGYYQKDSGGTNRLVANLDNSDVLNIGNADIKRVSVTNLYSNGWINWKDTLSYSSYTSNVKTGVINVGSNASQRYGVGMKVKFTQPTDGEKFGIITAVGASTITIYLGTSYDLDNEAISSLFVSMVKAPEGFPMSPLLWTVTSIDSTDRTQNSPVIDTYYNLGSFSILLPIGVWDIVYECSCGADRPGSGGVSNFVTLSTGNNNEINSQYTCGFLHTGTYLDTRLVKRMWLTITSPTTYYMNNKTVHSGLSILVGGGGRSPRIIRAVCGYL